MRVVGIDPAMGCTGVALSDGTTVTVKPVLKDDWRLKEVARQVMELVRIQGVPDLVVTEDCPSAMRGAAGKVIPMVHGVIRLRLMDEMVPYVAVAPSALKKFATGRGNADKTEMALAAFKRSGREFATSDECDASWCRWAGLAAGGEAEFDLPKEQLAVLDRIVWPAFVRPGRAV